MAEKPGARDEDMFSPSLTQTARRELPSGEKPWRLGSQFYVAFFGGPLAAGAIGYLNGRRLGLSLERQLAIIGIGIAGFAAALTVAGIVLDDESGGRRLPLAIAGVASYLACRQLQRDADRLYGLDRDEDQAYGSLWAPGLGAVLLLGTFSLIVLAAVL